MSSVVRSMTDQIVRSEDRLPTPRPWQGLSVLPASRYRLLAHGLVLKFVALLLGIAAVGVILSLRAPLDRPPARPDLIPWEIGAVAFAVLLDLIGRALCLAAAPLGGLRSILGSVLAQSCGLVCGSVGLVARVDPWAWGLAAACLQFSAAWLFMTFLRAVAEHLDRPDLAGQALRVRQALETLARIFGVLASITAILFLAALFTCGLSLFLLPWLLAWFGAVFGWVFFGPTVLILGLLLSVLYLNYAWVLLGLRRALVQHYQGLLQWSNRSGASLP